MLFGLLFSSANVWADSSEAYRQSYLLESKGNYAAALSRLNEIHKTDGASYFLSLRTGWLAYLSGDYESAESHYRAAISAKPKVIEPKIGLTLVLYVAQKWKALEVICKQVLADNPKHSIVRARLAAGYYAVNNYPDAAAIYHKLVEEYPAELDYQTGLAWALLRMGKRAEAHKIFQAVLAVSPDNPNALQGMALK
jgi:tetratricopeptide (TPR) repeat protein